MRNMPRRLVIAFNFSDSVCISFNSPMFFGYWSRSHTCEQSLRVCMSMKTRLMLWSEIIATVWISSWISNDYCFIQFFYLFTLLLQTPTLFREKLKASLLEVAILFDCWTNCISLMWVIPPNKRRCNPDDHPSFLVLVLVVLTHSILVLWHHGTMMSTTQLLQTIQSRILEGAPYIGTSAGSNVACRTIRTTNDMPIVQPPSFDALNLVPIQVTLL